MKIFVKLLAVFLAASVIPLGVIGFVSYTSMQQMEDSSLQKINRVSEKISGNASEEDVNNIVETAREDLSSQVEGFRNFVVLVIVGSIYGVVALAYGFAYTLSNPIEQLRREMRSIAEEVSDGNFDGTHITVDTDDEIGDLADSASKIITGMKYYIKKENSRY